ncbi:flagellar export apparatus, flagellum-specific ATP synthase FliI [Campylobacter pinnipediorum subsp. pinnipediorum]|uniref:EscN/YscN/HrcN family type III secretion system ATPase n=1 Tax=Campylobacter pinnipediorum subsp. pinnipediorum TaxID=1660067 RepID=A0AAX0LCK9_9BACT|nr:flagellar protein export ATPase FliI [Campylobacter pinnipediorum]AQW80444.1 flagellar export apparatus, flagellum-specific ATP synthase FliI [Campylobacter pinnipediorum subsp. pinnipediorum]AQW83792.1 flagellar export apparatus, flagellum-specific ATP synthase FliI [Campylobacter pinnipediorum subsp. pinnipediorum]OPA82170.1 EscN/YscN/HrcN family type III secretion system ATPase [Campylobacter pinnipediorum subsp. pinnipediorum]
MSLERIKLKLNDKKISLANVFGVITKITPTTIQINGLRPSIGDVVKISSKDKSKTGLGMVTQITSDGAFISPFGFVEGFRVGDFVYQSDQGMNIPVGNELLGRVVDPFMRPIDGKGPIRSNDLMPIMKAPIDAMKRGLINEPFNVGIKTIDGLLTCGKGQKLGIFAGSGVGKSTLMSMIVKNTQAPIKVVALIGERGREVPEFIEKNLKGDLTGTIIIVATSDDSALMRKYGAFCAMSVAEYFKEQGKDVLFIMDSVTRFAMAQREIGLALGEPPTSKGYPPSSLMLLPQLMERAGKEDGKGSITAFFTVLVEGDDMSDPIADQSRSILDGHIVLSRELTDFGIYPPINIQNSASRVMNDVVSKEHRQNAITFKRLYSLLKENEVLLRIGAYQKGNDKELDIAIAKKTFMNDFLKQGEDENFSFEEIQKLLKDINF